MRTTTVSKEYAKALFMLASREGKIDLIGAELAAFVRIIGDNERVGMFLLAPQISTAAKGEVLRKAITGKLSQEVVKFVLVTCAKRRLDELEAIAANYEDMLNEHHNRIEVSAVSAKPMTEAEIKSLSDKLAKSLEREVVVRTDVDPSLVAGLVCRVGDVVYDGSLRRRIDMLSNQMLKTKI